MTTETIDAQNFKEIKYEIQDVDTDRGILTDRFFNLIFESHNILIGEDDFKLLVLEMKKFIKKLEDGDIIEKKMFKDWIKQNPKEAIKVYGKKRIKEALK